MDFKITIEPFSILVGRNKAPGDEAKSANLINTFCSRKLQLNWNIQLLHLLPKGFQKIEDRNDGQTLNRRAPPQVSQLE